MATLIPAEQLIIKFKYAYDNKWGYIMNTAGILWTQAKQNATTNSYARQYGQQWVGHYVADCSGLFSWAFSQLGGYMDAVTSLLEIKYVLFAIHIVALVIVNKKLKKNET